MTQASATDYAIVCEELTRRYAGDSLAVDRLTLKVPSSGVFGFLGPNGAGKSTTTRMMCGLLRPTSGSVFVAGINVAEQPEAVKRRIGYVPQAFSFYEDLTAAENMDFVGRLYRVPADVAKRRRAMLIERTGFSEHLHKLAKALSGGWKQKLSICCALLHDPDIVFLDEPTAGIDPVSRREIWELLLELSGRGKTIFVTTHYMDEAERCHNVGFMFGGRLVAFGNPRQLTTSFNGGRILEIRTTSTTDAYKALLGKPQLGTAQIFYDTLHVVSSDPDAAVPLIHDTLRQHQIDMLSVTNVVPSLEDIFIHYINQAREAADATRRSDSRS
jgi:ABC-2 type transport system ATP-binding protein